MILVEQYWLFLFYLFLNDIIIIFSQQIGNGMNSCEAVDITELPQTSGQSLGYWVELQDLSTMSHWL